MNPFVVNLIPRAALRQHFAPMIAEWLKEVAPGINAHALWFKLLEAFGKGLYEFGKHISKDGITVMHRDDVAAFVTGVELELHVEQKAEVTFPKMELAVAPPAVIPPPIAMPPIPAKAVAKGKAPRAPKVKSLMERLNEPLPKKPKKGKR